METNFDNSRPAKVRTALASDVIPLFAGRPAREKVIGRDDLLDLDILLHTCDGVDELLAKL